MRTPSFKAVTGDVKISDIGVEGALGAGGEYGYMVNEDGTWGNAYFYLTEDEAFVPTGWYKDMVGEEAVTDDDVLKVGQAFFFAADSDVVFTYSGEVIKQPVVPMAAGFAMVGNPTPVTVKISEIAVEGALGAGGEYGYVVNPEGTWGTSYFYLTEDEAFVPTGWYKDMVGEEAVTDEDVLVAADALFFAADSDIEFTFPACL